MIHAPRAAEWARRSSSKRPNLAAARSVAAGFGRLDAGARARSAALHGRVDHPTVILPWSMDEIIHGRMILLIILPSSSLLKKPTSEAESRGLEHHPLSRDAPLLANGALREPHGLRCGRLWILLHHHWRRWRECSYSRSRKACRSG